MASGPTVCSARRHPQLHQCGLWAHLAWDCGAHCTSCSLARQGVVGSSGLAVLACIAALGFRGVPDPSYAIC